MKSPEGRPGKQISRVVSRLALLTSLAFVSCAGNLAPNPTPTPDECPTSFTPIPHDNRYSIETYTCKSSNNVIVYLDKNNPDGSHTKENTFGSMISKNTQDYPLFTRNQDCEIRFNLVNDAPQNIKESCPPRQTTRRGA
jgi:hypothetical protein